MAARHNTVLSWRFNAPVATTRISRVFSSFGDGQPIFKKFGPPKKNPRGSETETQKNPDGFPALGKAEEEARHG
jgi:hypothetical protein